MKLLFWLSWICASLAPGIGRCDVVSTQPIAETPFALGLDAYLAADYPTAIAQFQAAARQQPSPGAFHNLGNAQWKLGQTAPAILAWEQARWLDPLDRRPKTNLRLARRLHQLDNPELAWFEICSTWLPAASWAWLAGGSFWLAVALLVVPNRFNWRKNEWHQGLAAASFAVFLLTLPALAGLHTRSYCGIVLANPTNLRLTPTLHGQVLTRLPAGEMARLERRRGDYLYVRAGNDSSGWVRQDEFGLIVSVP